VPVRPWKVALGQIEERDTGRDGHYLCQYRGCSEKGKSTPKDKVQDAFEDLLRGAVPDRTTFELAERMFRDAWDRRSGGSKEEQKRLRTKAYQLDRDVAKLLERATQTSNDSVAAAYERRVADLVEASHQLAAPPVEYDKTFELAMQFLSSPYEI